MLPILLDVVAHYPRPGTKRSDSPIDVVFNWCVDLLSFAAARLGITYNAINVWVFCVIWPAVTLALIAIVMWQWRRIRRLRRALDAAAARESRSEVDQRPSVTIEGPVHDRADTRLAATGLRSHCAAGMDESVRESRSAPSKPAMRGVILIAAWTVSPVAIAYVLLGLSELPVGRVADVVGGLGGVCLLLWYAIVFPHRFVAYPGSDFVDPNLVWRGREALAIAVVQWCVVGLIFGWLTRKRTKRAQTWLAPLCVVVVGCLAIAAFKVVL
jgi:hypothetical protein